MAAPVLTITVKTGEALMRRIREICSYMEIAPASFIEHAIESELQRQEESRLQETRAVEEVQKGVLSSSHALDIHMDDDQEPGTVCELCLTPIAAPRSVEGPLLCDACMELAKSSTLDNRPGGG